MNEWWGVRGDLAGQGRASGQTMVHVDDAEICDAVFNLSLTSRPFAQLLLSLNFVVFVYLLHTIKM